MQQPICCHNSHSFNSHSIQSQDVMQTWLHWRCQDALLVQKHFMALFHPKPNECLHFDLESCNLMCTYTFVTHPCHIPTLAQARPMMLCIYISFIVRKCTHAQFKRGSLSSPNSCGDVIECNVRIARAERCGTGTRHAAHCSCKPHLSGLSISSSSRV